MKKIIYILLFAIAFGYALPINGQARKNRASKSVQQKAAKCFNVNSFLWERESFQPDCIAHDYAALYQAATGVPMKKGEFENNGDFCVRVQRDMAKLKVNGLSVADSTFVLPLHEITDFTLEKNASRYDTERRLLYFPVVTPMMRLFAPDFDEPALLENTGMREFSRWASLPLSGFVRTEESKRMMANAFGARVSVKEYSEHRYSLALLNRHIISDSSLFDIARVELPMSPIEAQASKPFIRSFLVTRLSLPYVLQLIGGQTATWDSPTSSSSEDRALVGVLEGVILVDMRTGAILKKENIVN